MEEQVRQERHVAADVIPTIIVFVLLAIAGLALAFALVFITGTNGLSENAQQAAQENPEATTAVAIAGTIGLAALMLGYLFGLIITFISSTASLLTSLFSLRRSPRKPVRIIGLVTAILSGLLLVATIVIFILGINGVFTQPAQ
jgi:membrane protease YdiL (CAAX protease family)